jgi:ADP-heptose:LPS heptosyltransferase
MPHVLAFVRLLAAELPEARLVLVGGAHERALAAGLARELPPALHARLVDCIDEASMGGTAALLARCAALVCTDSGPMHIADAVGTPMVALFSSKNYPAIWRPRYAPAEVLNHAVECGPCFRADCPYGNRCMALIDPAEVLAALHRILGASATRTLPAAPVSAAPARKVDA